MSLRFLLDRASFDADREHRENVIPIREFNPKQCAQDITQLDRKAREALQRVKDCRRNYEETLATLEADYDDAKRELDAKRTELRAWSEHYTRDVVDVGDDDPE